ncbi:probable membrane-associated kinase regulator 2 [Abrus precatorius]|uniref:Probable membrane-associated kinase regulator 2 n=1 Tax=Abrus precatorius TaxID=3816 RepID=A0A8B8M5Z4_ABRPR|nr:probable membrane-associated kinase regulator 2 [Abrus precatorius]
MEAFTLLKYWRGGGATPLPPSDTPTSRTTTILTAVPQNATQSDDDEDENNDDDGPFFDLEFAVPDDSEDAPQNPNQDEEEEDINTEEESDGEKEFKFTLSPSSNDRSDPNLSLSPSDDVFFKGKLVQLDHPSSEPNSKPQFTASLLKSATKFRVFMLGLKKPKSSDNASDSKKHQTDKKFFTVKFKVEEVPIMSLFTRDNSSRANKPHNQKPNSEPEDSPSSSEEKRFSKDTMQKYFKMVKPLYIRVSRRYGDKLGHLSPNSGPKGEGEASTATATETNAKTQKQGNLPAGLKVVCKHLGKSRSASSAVAASPPASVSSKRRDDSLLQQQDGIQGAILHCKRSFNASRECESSQLPRSVSDPSHEISSELSRKSINEAKDKRL